MKRSLNVRIELRRVTKGDCEKDGCLRNAEYQVVGVSKVGTGALSPQFCAICFHEQIDNPEEV